MFAHFSVQQPKKSFVQQPKKSGNTHYVCASKNSIRFILEYISIFFSYLNKHLNFGSDWKIEGNAT